jgi:prepilin-type N-terminal cleavage/methylation domain-containing protein
MYKEKRGFTLVELLVVISIIALLSSVVFASLNSAIEKAAVVSIIANLKSVEKAFYLLADDENISLWWPEIDFGSGGNPNISVLVTNMNRLGKFLGRAPSLPIGTDMGYDNDQDIFICGDSGPVYRGVNIHIRNISLALAQKVNAIVDGDANINCGRIKWDPSGGGGGSLFYVISENYLVF